MADRCPAHEELLDLARLPVGDRGRAHLDRCPRCQAQLATLQEFQRGDDPCEPGELAWASERLQAALDREIHGELGRRTRVSPSWTRGALALAAVLLVALGVSSFWPHSGGDLSRPPEIRLRTEGPARGEAGIATGAPRPLPGGGVELTWTPVSTATSYAVELMDASLVEVATIAADDTGSLRLDTDRLGELLPGPGVYAWAVIARQDSDEIARSQPATFRYESRP